VRQIRAGGCKKRVQDGPFDRELMLLRPTKSLDRIK
jgi:hypothetical protein